MCECRRFIALAVLFGAMSLSAQALTITVEVVDGGGMSLGLLQESDDEGDGDLFITRTGGSFGGLEFLTIQALSMPRLPVPADPNMVVLASNAIAFEGSADFDGAVFLSVSDSGFSLPVCNVEFTLDATGNDGANPDESGRFSTR